MKLGPGVQVGPYQIVEQIGRGGMATVFKAYQPALERMVALKVLPEVLAEDPQFRERFRREAVAIAKLRHPSILTVYDHGEFEDQLYIVTEYVEGGTLAGELGKPLGIPRTTEVLGSIASALDYAHRQGVLHRDVKPSNILINKEGAAVLGDFGLARMMAPTGERLTRIDMVVGTPEYMSPEQCAGKDAGPASDQYSLGVVAFEALTGHVPYDAETPAAVMLEQMQAPLPNPRTVNPNLSENVEHALMRALAKVPSDRFASCGEFIDAIAGKNTVPLPLPLKEKAVPVAAPAPPRRAPSAGGRFPRSRILIAAGVVALLVVASVAVALLAQRPGGTSAVQSNKGPAHGSLLFDLKPNAAAWSGGAEPSPDPDKSVGISYTSGSIDLKVLKTGANLYGEFDGERLKNYVADFVFKADTGSDFGLNWEMIPGTDTEQADVYLHIDFAQEDMTLVLSPHQGDIQALTATIPIPRLQQGSTTDITAAVNSGTITLYLNGNKVGQGSETRASGAATPAIDLSGDHGTLHILSLRYYAPP
jgi:serine/threonine protein kinase